MKKLIFPGLSLILAAIFAFTFDQSVSQWFDLPAHESWRLFALDITDVGKAEQWFALSILVYICSRFIPRLKSQRISAWALHFFSALVVSGLSLHVIKFTFGRQRPHMSPTREALVFHPFNTNWDFQSFASGHTQTLFCVASLFVLLWPKKSKWIWIAAAALAFTRVIALQHFVSDIIGGALIGIYGTQWSLRLLSKKIPIPQKL